MTTEEALGPELYRKHLLKVAGVDVDDPTIPPSALNNLADDLEWDELQKTFRKDFGIDQEERRAFYDDHELNIEKFCKVSLDPGQIPGEQNVREAFMHSMKLGVDLAKCQEALRTGKGIEADRRLKVAMHNYLHAHVGHFRALTAGE